jgi:two-component sensor histidine kinase
LQALGRAHDLLLQARWTSADLGKIVRGATEAFDSPEVPKFLIEGPDIQIISGAVIAIAMTLNELCTNTTKFGALSIPAGHVEIAWMIDGPTQRLRLTWTERDGPAVQAPTMRSFGTRLVETRRTKERRPLTRATQRLRSRARRPTDVYRLQRPIAKGGVSRSSGYDASIAGVDATVQLSRNARPHLIARSA